MTIHQKFHGSDYQPRRDAKRLQTQQDRIRDYLLVKTELGMWKTVPEIAKDLRISNPESVGRQIRMMDEPKFGSYRVEKRRSASGLYEFQVREPEEVLQLELEERA